jgi:hypothetical protein
MPFGDANWTRSSAIRLCLETTTRQRGKPRKETCPLFFFSGWDSLLVEFAPTIVPISLRRDEPFAMHVMAPKQANKSTQR